MADEVVAKAKKWLHTMHHSSVLGVFQHWKHLRADHVPPSGHHFENFLSEFLDQSNLQWIQFLTELPLKLLKLKDLKLIPYVISSIQGKPNLAIALHTLDYSDSEFLHYQVFFTRFSMASVFEPLTKDLLEERSETPVCFSDSVYRSLRHTLLFMWCIERRVSDFVYHRLNQFVGKADKADEAHTHIIPYHDELIHCPLRVVSGLLDCCSSDSFYEICKWYRWIVIMDICAIIKIVESTETKLTDHLFGAWLDYMTFMKFASACHRHVTFFTKESHETYVVEIVNYLNAEDKTAFIAKPRQTCFKVLNDHELDEFIGSNHIPFAKENLAPVPSRTKEEQLAIFIRYRNHFYNTLINSVASRS